MEHLDYNQQQYWGIDSQTPYQSPIKIKKSETSNKKHQAIKINFDSPILYEDRPVGEQFLLQGSMLFEDKLWQLERFHFHDGAEHLIDGLRHDMEMHFVFHYEEKILVVALFGNVNPSSEINIAALFNEQTDMSFLNHLLPEKSNYFSYLGTLTTPPLGENIRWIILENAIDVSNTDVNTLHEHYPNNYRDIQPLNSRIIDYFIVD
ncbi:carbonate dehydratase [Leuconostoc litchii]|uniref:Carbonic anhydrase family protein n=1 Tax=Leuconostoc litchii TaxID=1981069 RepID=A0A6P2CM89_9LACO|nr:carbonic anhydrase family protein [Leuconostoc litchii]TYC47070.1 carbonic anhydrase family protein [Leuconostoc litchii]GMA69006.1 carbonate dehydratase [Leuconostoc litchii]